MNPTDLNDPADLFGAEAVRDLRLLRRAYADLIRTHGPESDPVAFAHIRRLFEAARDALEQAPEPLPPDAPAGEGDEAENEWVDARLRQTTPEELAGLAESLAARAMDQGSQAAAVTYLALCEARTPTESVAWLTRLASAPAHREVAARLGHFLLATHTHQALCPDWPGLWAALDEASRHRLIAHRIEVLLSLGEGAAAFDLFRAHGSGIRRTAPKVWLSGVQRLLLEPGPGFDVEELVALETALDAVDLEIEPAFHDHLQRCIGLQHALRHAEGDLAVPAPLLEIIRLGAREDPPSRAHRLGRLVDSVPALGGALAHLRYHHPVLHARLESDRESLSHSSLFMMRWLRDGRPPTVRLTVGEGTLARLYQCAESGPRPGFWDELPPLPAGPPVPFTKRTDVNLVGCGTMVLCSLIAGAGELLPGLRLGEPNVPAVVLVLVLVAVVWGVLDNRRDRLQLARKAWSAAPPLPPEAVSQARDWLRATGLYPHELAALAEHHGARTLRRLAALLLADEQCEYLVLGPAHVERALREAAEADMRRRDAQVDPGPAEAPT